MARAARSEKGRNWSRIRPPSCTQMQEEPLEDVEHDGPAAGNGGRGR